MQRRYPRLYIAGKDPGSTLSCVVSMEKIRFMAKAEDR